MGSLEIETPNNLTSQNPYGRRGSPSHAHGSSSNARLYFMLCLVFFTLYGISNTMGPSAGSESFSTERDAAGGWGIERNHAIEHHDTSWITAEQKEITTSHYSTYPPIDLSNFDNEFLKEDFIMALTPIISIPSHARPEYEKYQIDGDGFDESPRNISELLADKNTAHGQAYDFIVNRDKRSLKPEDPQLIQRFVVTLLFYATGGHDENNPTEDTTNRGGWDSDMAHFLSGLHECHWAKNSLQDKLWELLSVENDDTKVGVTKCNDEMDVTEIRLANLNLVGFIPDEIKWLSSLQSFDVQNNHIAGPIPDSLGELDELRYLSLDGNNFSGSIPDVFYELTNLERAYLNFNDLNGSMPPSLCTLREDGALVDLWSDCGGYPITCTCCTVCCDFVAECDKMQSQTDD